MTEIPQIIEARYVTAYRIEVLFDTGVRKTIDFSPWLKGEKFEPFRSRRTFQQFSIAGGTICWPNGAGVATEALLAAGDDSSRGV